jgi:hypothetical protein
MPSQCLTNGLAGHIPFSVRPAEIPRRQFGNIRLCFHNGPRVQKRYSRSPAADSTDSLNWRTEIPGFRETFDDGSPPSYAGISRAAAFSHIAGMADKVLTRAIALDDVCVISLE